MTVDQQLEVLLRGTFFADEVEGAAGDSGFSTVNAATGEVAVDRSLRGQMTTELRERLKEGRPLRVYLGADPTRPSLHIGHFVPVQKLRVWQELGHQVIFLIGDYTGLIGDPTGQSGERKRFTHEELMAMSRDYTKQVFRLLDPEKTEVRYNGEWLSKLSFAQIIELAAIFPLKWIVSRRDFAERLARGESLRLHETLYALMQGYDAFALECDVQVGGYDQHFNLLAGRWIQEQRGQKPHICWTYPLLMGTDGRKMSKSYGNSIDIMDTPEDMYGKCMRISDELLASYIDLTTNFAPAEADALKARLREKGVNPMDIKKAVAANLVTQYHGADAATEAAAHFQRVVQDKLPPEGIELGPAPVLDAAGRVDLPTWLTASGLASSKTNAKSLLASGSIYLNDQRYGELTVAGADFLGSIVRKGKRHFLEVPKEPAP